MLNLLLLKYSSVFSVVIFLTIRLLEQRDAAR